MDGHRQPRQRSASVECRRTGAAGRNAQRPCCRSLGAGVFAERRSAGERRRSRTACGCGSGREQRRRSGPSNTSCDGHNGTITAIRFTPDGQRLITASGDRTCGQWDLASGQELRNVVLKHPEWVSSLDLSADGTLALTTCDDGVARLWRLADATVLAAVKSPGKPFNAIGISPDGSTAVLTSSEDKQVSLWDLSAASAGFGVQGQIPRPQPPALPRHLRPFLDFNQLGGEVWSAMFAPDGRHVLTIGGNDAQLVESRFSQAGRPLQPAWRGGFGGRSPDGDWSPPAVGITRPRFGMPRPAERSASSKAGTQVTSTRSSSRPTAANC